MEIKKQKPHLLHDYTYNKQLLYRDYGHVNLHKLLKRLQRQKKFPKPFLKNLKK